MHVPNPLGGYPLVLRTPSRDESRYGELLFEYTENKIYYRNKETGEIVDIAKSIYEKIIGKKAENNKIYPVKESSTIVSDQPVIPDPDNRKFNSWYFNTYKKSDFETDE